jgi:hypothetical protein
MFRALFVHPLEALHKLHLVYCMRMSVGCAAIAVSIAVCCVAPVEDEQVMLETCRALNSQ